MKAKSYQTLTSIYKIIFERLLKTMTEIHFHPISLSDKADIIKAVSQTECRNCDLNFMNLMSWKFLYNTETTTYNGWQLFRFTNNGHRAYLIPIGKGDLNTIIPVIMEDAKRQNVPFLMLGVCENNLTMLDEAMPGYFYATADRDFTDYIYHRDSLATLSGKKLQPKRNHCNKFEAAYPDFVYEELTPNVFEECLNLEKQWTADKMAEYTPQMLHEMNDERRSLSYVFENWEHLGGQGALLRVKGQLVAFTYGAPINYDTFDVCVEKADTNFEGAFAMINREFVRHLPEQYSYINREEDLGIPGLRHSKISYHPAILLHKYAVMTRHPFAE